jgi:hypothetical protein
VRGVLRLIADLDATEAVSDEALPTKETRVTFAIDGVGERTFRVSGEVLGGRVLVHVEDPTGPTARLADAGLAKLFEREGVQSWRLPGAVQRMPDDISRVRLESAGRRVTVGRVAGRWKLFEPIAVPGNAQVCGTLLGQIHTLAAKRFIDDDSETDAALGLASPNAFIGTECDIRTASGAGGDAGVTRLVLQHELRIGGQADPGATTIYASAAAFWLDPSTNTRRPAWGPQRLVLTRADLDVITADPTPYVSRTAVQEVVEDVAGVIFSPLPPPEDRGASLRRSDRDIWWSRSIDGWRVRTADNSERDPSDEDRAELERWLVLLCAGPADHLSLDGSVVFDTLAYATVLGRSDAPLETVTIGAIPEGGALPAGIVVQTGNIMRVYRPKHWKELDAWLRAKLPPEG